jgi:mRNA-degrading endonuclease YafQ of YafQ-DinJ toxin-antitoxin module
MIDLDLNNANFQKDLFALEKTDLTKVMSTLRKIVQMTWEQVYQDHGLNWEWIEDKDYYTLRASQKIRLAAKRDGNVLRMLGIFSDHDSAYN